MSTIWISPLPKLVPDTFVRLEYGVNARENLAGLSNLSKGEQDRIGRLVSQGIKEYNYKYLKTILDDL